MSLNVSFIEDAFLSARALRQTYVRLMHLGEGPVQKRGRRVVRGKVNSAAQAKRSLRKLDNVLLEKLTPEVLQDLCDLEHPIGADPWEIERAQVVCKRLWQMASRSLQGAKRLTSLIVQATLFRDRRLSDGRPDDAVWCFLTDSMLAPAIFKSPSMASRRIAFEFVDRLTTAAPVDDTAHYYLRLIYRALMTYRSIMIPVLDTGSLDQTLAFANDCVANMTKGNMKSQGGFVQLKIPYPAKNFMQLDRAFRAELDWMKRECDYCSPFSAKVRAVRLVAFAKFHAVLWRYVLQQSAPHLVLTGGRDKVDIVIPGMGTYGGLCSMSFVREKPAGGWYVFPRVGVNLFFEGLCEHHVTHIELNEHGHFEGFSKLNWPEEVVAALWCIVLDAYAEIVVPPDQKDSPDNPRGLGRRLRKRHHAAEDDVAVRAFFRRLRQGHRASSLQIGEAIAATGSAPPLGYTFVGEFNRGFPGVSLPYREARDLWKNHRRTKSVLALSAATVDSLLADVMCFS